MNKFMNQQITTKPQEGLVSLVTTQLMKSTLVELQVWQILHHFLLNLIIKKKAW
jgi:hypothetical protein